MSEIRMQKSKLRNAHSLPGTPLPFEGHRIRQVTRGRTAEAAKAAIAAIPEERHTLVLAAAMDMNGPYQKAVSEELPETDICFERFHVSALLNKTVNTVRRSEHKQLSKEGDDTLKNSRYLRLKNPEKQTRAQKKRFRRLKAMHLKVGTTWAIKEGAVPQKLLKSEVVSWAPADKLGIEEKPENHLHEEHD
jgi:hypothetical protein